MSVISGHMRIVTWMRTVGFKYINQVDNDLVQKASGLILTSSCISFLKQRSKQMRELEKELEDAAAMTDKKKRLKLVRHVILIHRELCGFRTFHVPLIL